MLGRNRSRVIALMKFPADFVLDGRGVKFETDREFENKYDKFFTPYVITSVRDQDPAKLIAGWEGVSLSNEAVRFRRTAAGSFRIDNVIPRPVTPPDSLKDFVEQRLTCPPVVVEGRIIAYNWVTHTMPGFEDIYIDHFIVDVTNVLSGRLLPKRIRVDFWGVSHLPDYNLPTQAFEAGSVWRLYLRAADELPINPEVCGKDVQETITSVDEAGRDVDKRSAITTLTGETSLTYAGLPCFEAGRQFFDRSGDRISESIAIDKSRCGEVPGAGHRNQTAVLSPRTTLLLILHTFEPRTEDGNLVIKTLLPLSNEPLASLFRTARPSGQEKKFSAARKTGPSVLV